MSLEARTRQTIDDAVRRAVEPLERAVDALSARLAAVEGDGGPSGDGAQKRPVRGRTARAKAQPAESGAASDDPFSADTKESGE